MNFSAKAILGNVDDADADDIDSGIITEEDTDYLSTSASGTGSSTSSCSATGTSDDSAEVERT